MDLTQIKKRLESFQPKTPKEKIDYTKIYFKPQPGKYQIRIVPSKFNKTTPFREVYFHYGYKKFPILALTNWGEKDPIVDLVQQLRKTKEPENWSLAKKLEPKMRVFVPVIIRGEEEQGVRLWEFGIEIYKELMKWTEDEDFGGDYTDILEGRDFTVEVEKATVAKRDINKVTSVRIKPKTSPLSENAELVKKLLEEQPDVLNLYKHYEYDELKEILQNFLDPKDESEDENSVVGEEISEEIDEDENNNSLPFVKENNEEKFEKLFKDKK